MLRLGKKYKTYSFKHLKVVLSILLAYAHKK